MKSVNVIIREIREDRDLTQREVAGYLGITQQYYSQYESGKYELPTRYLRKLADYYGVSTDYIMGRTKLPKPMPSLDEEFLKDHSMGQVMMRVMTLRGENRKLLWEVLNFLEMRDEQN